MRRAVFAALSASALLLLSQADAAPIFGGGSNAAVMSAPGASAVQSQSSLEALLDEAQGGDVEAMNFLGVLYASTAQLTGDYSMALFWLQKAIDEGSANAMNNLAVLYLAGTGVPRDYANAFRWFGRAAGRGNVSAMYSFAVMADEGVGTARDPKLARTMYRRAAERGVAIAMVRVSDDYARGSGVRRDPVEAYAWLQLAIQAGTPAEMQIAVLAKSSISRRALRPTFATRRDCAPHTSFRS